MARILCRDLTKRFGSVTAVDRLNLEIHDREFMVLLGPSGCGKTTTLNIIAGLEELSAGDLYFDDTVVNFMPPHKREVAMVFQSYALYPHKTVYENIAFGMRLRRLPAAEIDQRVRAAAAELEIAHLLERRPHQLSGGQRQRVALGRAIVRKPSVFLMDEPLSNLDAALRISMRTLIKKLHQTIRTTFVYVTHDQAEALTLADRIAVMKDGLLQQLGTPDEVYHRPRNLFVASFLGSPPMNFIEGRLEIAQGALCFRRGGLSLALAAETASTLRRPANGTVVLGIRPEDVALGAASDASGRFAAKVALVSPLGSENYLDVVAEGTELMFRVDKDTRPTLGAEVTFAVNPRRLHLFDKATGEALLA